jgi:C-terminal processing protease CtpA/Prc
MLVQAGFVRVTELGYSGLTIGTASKDDGVITAVEADSAAAHAGLEKGDLIIEVEGKAVKPTPGMMVEKAVFGRKGDALHLTARHGGANQNVSLVRGAEKVPAGAPKAPNIFLVIKDLINWRGQFLPCMGAGPLAPAALDLCTNRFKPNGFVAVKELGSTGFQVDMAREDGAFISSVDPNSDVAKAGIQPGDEILAVEGHPLSGSIGEEAKAQIFGKAGDQLHIRVRRMGTDMTVVLKLAAKPQS